MAEHGAHHDLARAEPHDEVRVGDEVGQRHGGDPCLQLRSDAVAEQVEVVGPDPAADVAVGDDDRSGVTQRLVAAGVIEMIVGVDDVADRPGRQPADLGDERLGRVEREEAVDHQDAVVADDEARVGPRLVLRPVDRGVDAGTDLFEDERKRRRRGGVGRRHHKRGEHESSAGSSRQTDGDRG